MYLYARTCFLEIHSKLKHASTIMHLIYILCTYYCKHSAAEKSVPSPFRGKNFDQFSEQ
jgi:hypothetical protein